LITDKATTFELLHPAYMAKLIDVNEDIGIEVVDNVLYLYAVGNVTEYEVLYGLLIDAFEQMKM
jgi:hypothetical protein